MKKVTIIALEFCAIVFGLCVWVGLWFYFQMPSFFGGLIGSFSGLMFVLIYNWFGTTTGYWQSVDTNDFRVYGWIPWFLP